MDILNARHVPERTSFQTTYTTFSEQERHALEFLHSAAPNLMNAVRLGIEMRDRQKAYFKDRSRENLIASKAAEKAFDDAAASVVVEATVRLD